MSPSQKTRLYADRLRQLERLGLSTSFEFEPPKNPFSDVTVEQCGIDLESPVVGLEDERTLYVVWLSLVAERPGVHLYDYRFEPPWPDRNFEMLPSFTESCVGQAYVLPNRLEYTRGDVLNFRFGKSGWRLPYSRVEGVLCGLSATPIPQEFKHGASIPVGVKFFGKFGKQLAAASAVLWADRWDERTVARPVEKLSLAPDEAGPAVAARLLRSGLYGPSGGSELRVAGHHPENEAPPTTEARESSLRSSDLGK